MRFAEIRSVCYTGPVVRGIGRVLAMIRFLGIACLILGLSFGQSPGQDLTLDDQDLRSFEDPPAAKADVSPPILQPSMETPPVLDTTRYDRLIDELKAQLRQLRIDLRDRPERIRSRAQRLESLEAAEEELRYQAFEKVVYRWPRPIYEDFDRALEEALERHAIRHALLEEIRAEEREIERLSQQRRELEADLDQAIGLKTEAMEAYSQRALESSDP